MRRREIVERDQWPTLTAEELDEQIQLRQELLNRSRYPRILRREISELAELRSVVSPKKS